VKLGVVAVAVAFLMIGAADTSSAGVRDRPVFLRSGQMGRYLWSFYVELPESEEERAAGRVCPTVSMLEPTGSGGAEGQSSSSCAAPPSGRPTVEYESGGSGGGTKSVVAVLLPPAVRDVKLKLRGEAVRTLRAGHASVPGSEGRPSIPLAFAAKGIVGRVCIESIEGISAGGAVVSRLGRQHCF
jgi:hypothetical protein